MKIREYISHLTVMAVAHPDLEVVYASDEEGNSYDPVRYRPLLGHYDGVEFEGHEDVEDKEALNAVCIN